MLCIIIWKTYIRVITRNHLSIRYLQEVQRQKSRKKCRNVYGILSSQVQYTPGTHITYKYTHNEYGTHTN